MEKALEDLWRRTLENLKKELNVPTFQVMFQDTKPQKIEGDTIFILTPNQFIKEWLETRHREPLLEAIFKASGRNLKIQFVISSLVSPDGELSSSATTETHSYGSGSSGRPGLSIPTTQPDLNPRYTFDAFVVGSSNRFAQAAALAVAERPAQAYNPLFIYGGVGLGKTHLVQAIGNFVRQHHPHLSVRYVTSEKFTNDFIQAVMEGNSKNFQRKYREVDILLIDDIQFLAGKEQTQEEFFHTFNALYGANKQIVITSDRPPREISPLEERLKSRFESGLLTDIKPPDLETRIAILKKKANQSETVVPPEVLEFIASHIKSNIRELEGALIRVEAYSKLTRQPITLSLSEEILKDILINNEEKVITPELIISEVCRFYSLKKTELLSSKRQQTFTYPRQIAIYLCRELTDLSFPSIGKIFGGRDHTTVIHSYNKICDLLSREHQCFQEIQVLIRKIKEKC